MRAKKHYDWKSTQCPKCGCWWNHRVYVHRSGDECCRIYGTWKGKWVFDKNAIKPFPEFRVQRTQRLIEGLVILDWEEHPNPKWKPTGNLEPVVNCCKEKARRDAK